MDVQIEQGWKQVLKEEFNKPYFGEIVRMLKTEKQAGRTIYPPGPQIFNAFNSTPFDKVKVVIIGQDPYHGPGQAQGLCFSVAPGIKPPPSLVNIFKEIRSDLGIQISGNSGDLSGWARQGVLLLNAALTVRAGDPNSHSTIGWTQFTDAVIKLLSEKKSNIVFLLWGKFAQEKQAIINSKKNYVLTAAHPSPFSADKGFFGCRHFSKTNELLAKGGMDPIDWKVD
jgi:uracil-DNA glycosylase